jgi:hypothetical protein
LVNRNLFISRSWRITSSLAAILLATSLSLSQSTAGTDTLHTVDLFPSARLFPRCYADGVAPRFGVGKDLNTSFVHGDIGGHLPLLQLDAPFATFQCGAGATVLTSLIKKPGILQVVTADFLVEFPLDVRLSRNMTLRTGYGHFSAHFADDGIEILHKSSVNYAKDYMMFFSACRIPVVDATVYAGGHWNFHSLPEVNGHWMVQLGFDAFVLQLSTDCCLYAAADVQLKSEVAWATTQSYQCGFRFFPRGERALRIAYTHRSGIDDRGQFYRDRTIMNLVGVYLDY